MKVLVFGATGQLGHALRHREGVQALDRSQADLSDPESCAAIIRNCAADAVINAAAYTAVDRAEEEEALATTINGTAPTRMAMAAAERNLPFLTVSTDYVFAGNGDTPHRPDDPTAPLNAYGRSKLIGEQGVRAAGGKHAILRTSWVFSAHGNNFVKTMLRLGTTRSELNIVADQAGGPTEARDIADTLFHMAASLQDGAQGGTYHYAGAPAVSWADFAREIFAQAGLAVTVSGIPSSAYPTPARRPLNSRLDCQSLSDDFGIAQPDWRASLARVLAELDQTP